ncbi:MAG: Hsp20/alpha crystallin family protein [Actinobacteria bacterium]|nr:Hsp20/alpha crystallin family protein [Actinomycetota bacterium]
MARQTRSATPIRRESRLPRRSDEVFSPFGTVRQIQDEMSRLIGSFWSGLPYSPWANRPAVDFYEEGDQWIVEAELPGVEPNDIDVQVNENGLEISAKSSSEEKTEDKDKGYYRTERSYGSFRRFLPLPGEVDPKKVKAKYRNGVLEIRMPRGESTSGRRIPVEAPEDGGSKS